MALNWDYEDELTTLSQIEMLSTDVYQDVYSTNITMDLTHFVYSSVERILVTIVAPLIFGIGMLGNAAVVLVFHQVPEIRTTTNFFLISLALADMVFLLSAVPAYWGQYLSSPIPLDFTNLGRIYCKVHAYFADVGIIVSCLTVGLVTLERYLAICHPLVYRGFSDKKRIVFSCVMVWAFSLIYKIPDLHFTDVYLQPIVLQWPNESKYNGYPTRYSTCEYCQPRDLAPCKTFRYSLAIDQILLLIEIPIITMLYICVVLELRRLSLGSHHRTQSDTQIKDKITVIRMLIITIVVYIICISPFRVINLSDIFGQQLPINAYVYMHISRMMMYTNSAVNPILYNIISNSFSKAFRQTFCCQSKMKRKKHVFENILMTDLRDNTLHGSKSNIHYNLVANGDHCK